MKKKIKDWFDKNKSSPLFWLYAVIALVGFLRLLFEIYIQSYKKTGELTPAGNPIYAPTRLTTLLEPYHTFYKKYVARALRAIFSKLFVWIWNPVSYWQRFSPDINEPETE